jgi:hypothetical protein
MISVLMSGQLTLADTSAITMKQFTMPLRILRTSILRNHNALPLRDAPGHLSDLDLSTDYQRPVSRWDWHEEESSVSSSFTDAQSEDDYDVEAWEEAATLANFERVQCAAALRP